MHACTRPATASFLGAGGLPRASAAAAPCRRVLPMQRHTRMAHKPCNASTKGPLDPLFDSIPDPILRAVIKEPIAFWGGVFAGALGLSVTEDPLKSWIQRTSGSGAGEGGGRPGSGGVAVSTQVQHRDEPVLKR